MADDPSGSSGLSGNDGALVNQLEKGEFKINKLTKTIILGVVAGLMAVPAHAGMFSVTPVRIYMAPRDKAIAVTITNDSDEDLVMQADVYDWKQKPGGEDDLALTDDMLVSPPIIKVPAKSHQVVRLARLRAAPQAQQLTYRLIVREIPEAKPAKDKVVQLQVALAFSMPVFITPAGAKANLSCMVQKGASNNLNAVCENTGSAYVEPLDFVVTDPTGKVVAGRDSGGYILPTTKRIFDIKSADKPIPSGKAVLTVKLDDGTKQSFDVMIPE
jgi:fimbrial chaperone protein